MRRGMSFGGRPGYWKTGLKFVGRDKTQDRENENYNGSGFTLADFGLAGPRWTVSSKAATASGRR